MRKKFCKYIPVLLTIPILLAGCRNTENAVKEQSADAGNSAAEALSEAESIADAKGAESVAESAIPSAVPSETPSPTPASVDLTQHVKNIRNFSLLQGTVPDPMSGISWDSDVSGVSCDTGGADWNTPGTYTLTYTITGSNGQTTQQSVQATVEIDLEQYLYGMEGDAQVQIGQNFDPMANVVYDDEIASITPDTSELDTSKAGEYLISYKLTGQDGKVQTAIRKVTVTDPAREAAPGNATAGNSTVTDLGVWRLTAYMDTPADQGAYVGQTASGSPLVAGETVAVSQATCARLGLKFGDKLMIDGHVYTLEDYGGSAMNDQNWVDIFVSNEADEYSEQYNKYTEVYLLK